MKDQWILVANASVPHLRFTHEITQRLDKGSEFDSLLLFASNPFLGELRAPPSEAVEKRVTLRRDNDLTDFRIAGIEPRLPGPWVEAR